MRFKAFCGISAAAIFLIAGCNAAQKSGGWLYASRAAAGNEREADFDNAVTLAAKLNYSDAAAEFSSLLEKFEAAGDRTRAAEAMFWMAYCYEKQGQTDNAVKFYNLVLEKYPEAPAARQARNRLSCITIPPSP